MNISLFLITLTQVVTESLPISSSSHLRLVGYLLTLSGVELPAIVHSPQWESFEHLLHIPTVVVVGLVIIKMQRQGAALHVWVPSSLELRGAGPPLTAAASRIGVPLVIATAVTVAFYYIKRAGMMPFLVPTWLGLAITGCLLLTTKWLPLSPRLVRGPENKEGHLSGSSTSEDDFLLAPTCLQGALIGLAQGIALGPGISRLGVTYCTGVFLGLGNLPALLFSFMLQLILMSGAIVRALLKLAYQLSVGASRSVAGMEGTQLLSTSLFSFQTFAALTLGAFVAYRLLLLVVRLVQRNRLWPLSVYLFALSSIWVILNLP